jgi:hypothetical protein
MNELKEISKNSAQFLYSRNPVKFQCYMHLWNLLTLFDEETKDQESIEILSKLLKQMREEIAWEVLEWLLSEKVIKHDRIVLE